MPPNQRASRQPDEPSPAGRGVRMHAFIVGAEPLVIECCLPTMTSSIHTAAYSKRLYIRRRCIKNESAVHSIY